MEEIIAMVKQLPLHKPTSLDLLPYTYYKLFLSTLAPHVLALYHSLHKGETHHSQFLLSNVFVILKGKDQAFSANYRPVDLLYSD